MSRKPTTKPKRSSPRRRGAGDPADAAASDVKALLNQGSDFQWQAGARYALAIKNGQYKSKYATAKDFADSGIGINFATMNRMSVVATTFPERTAKLFPITKLFLYRRYARAHKQPVVADPSNEPIVISSTVTRPFSACTEDDLLEALGTAAGHHHAAFVSKVPDADKQSVGQIEGLFESSEGGEAPARFEAGTLDGHTVVGVRYVRLDEWDGLMQALAPPPGGDTSRRKKRPPGRKKK